MSSTSNTAAKAAPKEAFPSQEGPTRVSLASLASKATLLQSKHLFRGTIKTFTPYSSHQNQCAITLESLVGEEKGTLHIVFKGTWSADLKEPFEKAKKAESTVSLMGMEGVQKERSGKDGKNRHKIEYSKGVKGYLKNEEDEIVPFDFKSKGSTKANSLTTATTSRTTPLQELSQASAASGTEVQADSQDALEENSTAGAGVKRPSAQEIKREKKKAKTKTLKKEWGLEVIDISGKMIKYRPLNEAAQKITDAASQKTITKRDIIAIVQVSKPRTQLAASKSTDWGSTLSLHDPSLTDGETVGINLFADREAYLPDAQNGDVVIFTGINYDTRCSNFVGYSNSFRSSVIPASSLASDATQPSPATLPRIVSYGKLEWEYAKQLHTWWKEQDIPIVIGGVQEEPVRDAKAISAALRKKGGGTARKLLEMKDMEANKFCDFIGEVVKIYRHRSGFHDEHEVYLSDYTMHEQVYEYTPLEDSKWVGPWGQRTLKCDLQGALPENLQVGHILRVRNLRPKVDGTQLLEGSTWLDQAGKSGKTSPYTIITDGREFEALNSRRKAYWKFQHSAISSGTAEPGSTAPQQEEVKALGPTACTLDQPLGHMKDAIESALNSPFRLSGQVVDLTPLNALEWTRASCPECKIKLAPAATCCFEHKKVEYNFNIRLYIRECSVDEGETSGDAPAIVVLVSGDNANTFLGLTPTGDMRQEGSEHGDLLKRLKPLLGRVLSKKRNQDDELELTDAGAPFEFAVVKIKEAKPGGEHVFAFVQTKIV